MRGSRTMWGGGSAADGTQARGTGGRRGTDEEGHIERRTGAPVSQSVGRDISSVRQRDLDARRTSRGDRMARWVWVWGKGRGLDGVDRARLAGGRKGGGEAVLWGRARTFCCSAALSFAIRSSSAFFFAACLASRAWEMKDELEMSWR